MIKSISHVENVNTLNLAAQQKTKNKSNSSVPLRKNVSFKSQAPVADEYKREIAKLGTILEINASGAVKKMSALPPASLDVGTYYDKMTDNLAILLGPDKNIAMELEDETNPEILVEQLVKNVNKGKYIGQGFVPNKTEIFHVSIDTLINNGLDATPVFNLLSGSNPCGRKIAFVEDIHYLAAGLISQGCKNLDSDYLSHQFPNVTFVSMIPKKVVDQNMLVPTSSAPNAPSMRLNSMFDSMNTIRLKGLGVSETKQLLKNNPAYAEGVLSRYPMLEMVITKEGIDAIVDSTAVGVKGAFPNKALEFLDFIATKQSNDHFFKGAEAIIGPDDVKKFFSEYSQLVSTFKHQEGKVKLAENVTTRFKDVGGASQVIEELSDDILAFIKDPEEYIKSGMAAPKGKLIFGPPGTGKTLVVRALAGEAGVPFFHMKGSDFGKGIVDSGSGDVTQAFADVRDGIAQSEKKIGIFFIDEIDALGQRRSDETGVGASEDNKKLTAFLSELDGFDNKESEIKLIVIGATNRKNVLDPALIDRPSRLGDMIEMGEYKLKKDRLEILQIHADGKPFASESEKARILDQFAEITEGLNGDKLANILNKTMSVVHKKTNKVIEYEDMFEGFLRTISGKVKDVDIEPDELRTVVAHEGGHAFAHKILNHGKVLFVSNEPRGDALGTTWSLPDKRQMETFGSVIKELVTKYAGGYAEAIINKVHASGVSGDFRSISSLINSSIKAWGLGVHTPQISFVDKDCREKADMVQRYSGEIKKDEKLFIQTSEKISRRLAKMERSFLLDVHLKAYDEAIAAGKKGNYQTGEAFNNSVDNWLESTKQVKKREQLLKWADRVIEAAQNSNKDIVTQIAKRVIARFRR